MSQGPHAHDWHYGEARQITHMTPTKQTMQVVRFCKLCYGYEEVELSELTD